MVDIIIPHKNSNDIRVKNLKFVIKYYKTHLKESNIIIVEQDSETDLSEFEDINHIKIKTDDIFSRSLCINLGVKEAISDFLIISDNDIIIDSEFLHNIDVYKNYTELIIPYNFEQIKLDENETNNFINNNVLNWHSSRKLTSGAINIISKESFYKIGGFDLNLDGYGYEDVLFYKTAKKIIGVKHLEYKLYHLWHPIIENSKKLREQNKIKYVNIIHFSDDEFNNYINENIDKLNKLNTISYIEKKPISILITAYKTAEYIEQCLDSIIEQSYFVNNSNYEILLAIDNCEETLSKILEIQYKYNNLKFLKTVKNVGTYAATNLLINLSKYDILLRFDSDDIMNNNLIYESIKFIDNFDIVRYKCENFSIENNNMSNFLSNGSFMFKRNILNILGGFRNWKIIADREFLVRAENSDFNIKKINSVLYKRRIRPGSLTFNKNTNYESELRKQYIKKIEFFINYKKTEYVNAGFRKHIKYYAKNEKRVINVIIPHKNVDHYRERNIRFLIQFYKKYIHNVNIIVVEQDTETDLSGLNINHIKFKLYKDFSRSICLNMGVKHAIGDNLVLTDSDVIINIEILNNVYKYFKEDIYVIPYNTPVIDLTEKSTINLINDFNNYIESDHNIDVNFNLQNIHGVRRSFLAVGGIGLINKKTFLKVGGFDEHIIGWGSEDSLFYNNMIKLFKVQRLEYNLYHMYHDTTLRNTKSPLLIKNRKYYYDIAKLNHFDFLLYIKQQQSLNFKCKYIDNKYYCLNCNF